MCFLGAGEDAMVLIVFSGEGLVWGLTGGVV